MWTGVVSTATVTHATPGACYAHTPNRDWESDAELTPEAAAGGFPDIARQLVDFQRPPATMNGKTSPGLEVALGGGRTKFLRFDETDPEDPEVQGERQDAQTWPASGRSAAAPTSGTRKGFDADRSGHHGTGAGPLRAVPHGVRAGARPGHGGRALAHRDDGEGDPHPPARPARASS